MFASRVRRSIVVRLWIVQVRIQDMKKVSFTETLGSVVIFLISMLFFQLGLAQDPQNLPKAFVDGTGLGWRSLEEGDFANVNCRPDTWTWKGKVLFCTGQPIGVMRTRQLFTNFELVVEWRHLRSGGN